MNPRYGSALFSAFGLAASIAVGPCAPFVLYHGSAWAQGAPAAQPAALDEGVSAALRKMSAALGGAQELTVVVNVLREAPISARSEQQVTLGGSVAVGIQRPGRLAALVAGDRGNFRLWYDGEAATLLSLTESAYARRDLPGDIETVLDALESRFGVEVPLRDLLVADPYAALTEPGTTGVHIGQTLVNGAACEHYALRNREVDWQIWIAAEGPALPCRLVVVDRSVPGMSRAVLEFLTWNLSPQLDSETFTFTAPADAHEVVWLERPANAPAAGTR